VIPDEAVEAAAFLERWAAHSGRTVEQVLKRRVVATCSCGEDMCEGWQVVPEEVLLPWRDERVVIRGG
jgi:hypothetical protein